ncbi:hypothetical protein [Desertihabitans brevis]|uniref:hypothetical protein n=1 Tax=Desertihabitans brevis TaxID=2268447 RepID=UPI0011BEA120|nr:hypothetical protein [Desertihabitans brevis]
MSFRLSRRSALTAGALGLAAVSGLTSGCQQEQDAGQQQQLNEQVELPTLHEARLGPARPARRRHPARRVPALPGRPDPDQ